MWIVATNMITNKNALIKRKTGLILLGAGTNCLIYTNRKGRWAKCLNLITSERKMSQKGMHSKETMAYCVSSFPVFSGRMGFRSRLPPGRGLLKYLSMNASATSGYLPFIKFCRHFRYEKSSLWPSVVTTKKHRLSWKLPCLSTWHINTRCKLVEYNKTTKANLIKKKHNIRNIVAVVERIIPKMMEEFNEKSRIYCNDVVLRYQVQWWVKIKLSVTI